MSKKKEPQDEEILKTLVDAYRTLRDEKKEVEERFNHMLANIKEDMAEIEGRLLGIMNELGVDSIKTSAGTAFTSTVEQFSVTDWGDIYELIRNDPDNVALLQKRIKKTAVKDYMDEHGSLPKGVERFAERKVNIRKPH